MELVFPHGFETGWSPARCPEIPAARPRSRGEDTGLAEDSRELQGNCKGRASDPGVPSHEPSPAVQGRQDSTKRQMIAKNLIDEIDSVLKRDPAAKSRLDVVFSYPGFHAVRIYRLAHCLWGWKLYFLGRLVSHFGRWLTGIEIHPGARIGRRLFIDHGMGVVIGETAEIGDDITLYQGVTLGGTSLAGGKRHPTLEDGVVVGAGAQVLGPVTVGTGARIGANAVVLKPVAAGATMVGIPARAVQPRPAEAKAETQEFCAYGTPSQDLPDPVARAIDGLCDQVTTLQARIVALESRLKEVEGRGEAPLAGLAVEPPPASNPSKN